MFFPRTNTISTSIKALIFTLLIVLTNCESNIESLDGPNTLVFNIDLFEQNLIDYVNFGGNQPVGWAYTISENGQLARSGAIGNAVDEPDGTMTAMTINKEINVASVTKFYTAIAVMQLLERLDLTIDTKIATYLPNSWVQGPGVDELSFGDLLKHESGLQSTNTNFNTTLSYQGIQDCIATGVVNSQNRNYLNVNFAIFRILIPSLQNNLPNAPLANLESDQTTQSVYRAYMQQEILNVVGVANIDFTVESNSPTKYYNVNDLGSNTPGIPYGDWTAISGGGGYYMSVFEMAAVNAFFEHSELLVTAESRDIMKLNRIGMDTEHSTETNGSYYGKNGSINNGGPAQGVLTQIQMFPNLGVDCVVVMNTQGVALQGSSSLRVMINNAFNDAFE